MLPRHPHRRWIVVADGGGAKVLALAEDGTSLETVRAIEAPDAHSKTQDIVSDRPGRSFESSSATRHGLEARTDAHDLAKEQFIGSLGRALVEDNKAGAFEDLVLVVATAQANNLMGALDDVTRAKVCEVVKKDLLKTPNGQIWDRMIEAGLLPQRPTLPPLR